jgi:hypothetical protein
MQYAARRWNGNARTGCFCPSDEPRKTIRSFGDDGHRWLAILLAMTSLWAASGFGELPYAITKRWVVPAVDLISLSVQFAASSFLLSVLRMARF